MLLPNADAAQALGASYAGQPIGAWGDLVCFSLGRGKAISAGEGGVLVTSDPDLYERLMLVSQHPLRCLREIEEPMLRASVTELGCSYRMTPVAAALALGQIDRVAPLVRRRRAAAARLANRIADLPGISLPDDAGDARHAYHAYVVRCRADIRREAVAQRFEARGVRARPGPIAKSIHLRAPFQAADVWVPRALRAIAPHRTWERGSCPRAERRCWAEDLCISLDVRTAERRTGAVG